MIAPPVAGFGIHDYEARNALIQIGYDAARRQLEAWQRRDRGGASPPP